MVRNPSTSIAVNGPCVAAARRAAALTQAELAARAGVTLSNVKRIEQRPVAGVFAHTLRALAAALGVEPDALVEGVGVRRPSGKPTAIAFTLDGVLAWLDRQRLDVVGEVLEHAGSILDLAASANGRRRRPGRATHPPSDDRHRGR